MNKNIIITIVIIMVLACIVGGIVLFTSDKEKESTDGYTNKETTNNKEKDEVSNETTDDKKENTPSNKKVLVVYFSASNNTKGVAEKIADNLNGDIFEIVPKNKYTSADLDWSDNDSRVTKEHNDESLRNIELTTSKVANWENYDTVLIGYPIWWGIAAWPVNTFVKANNFSGKTVIPFCTSASSGLGQSGELLKKEANGGTWLEGHRFSSRPSDTEIKTFTDSIR